MSQTFFFFTSLDDGWSESARAHPFSRCKDAQWHQAALDKLESYWVSAGDQLGDCLQQKKREGKKVQPCNN